MSNFIPKVIDKAYLAFIRSKPCAFCLAPPPSEPHHIRGIDGLPGASRKPSDHLAIPVCNKCHDYEQKYRRGSPEHFGWWVKMTKAVIFHLSEYTSGGKHG